MITESPSEYSANVALSSTEKLKPGHYLKRGDKVISKRYDNPDHALMAWRSLPSDRQAGVVVKHIKEEDEEITEEAEVIEEGHVETHIQQMLADRDINSEIKGGKLVVHRSNLAKTKYHVKKLGHTVSIIGGLNESEAHKIILDKFTTMNNLKTVKIPTPEERRAQIAQRKAEAEKAVKVSESLDITELSEAISDTHSADLKSEAESHKESGNMAAHHNTMYHYHKRQQSLYNDKAKYNDKTNSAQSKSRETAMKHFSNSRKHREKLENLGYEPSKESHTFGDGYGKHTSIGGAQSGPGLKYNGNSSEV